MDKGVIFYDDGFAQQFGKAREYHFLNMHVYVNALFQKNELAEKEHAYTHYDVRPAYFSKDHHVHIYMWRLNTDIENFLEMIKFIGEVNKIVTRPVYIHMPKRILYENGSLIPDIKSILKGIEYDGNELRYELILEKNSNVTDFQYGTYIPIPGQKYGSKYFGQSELLITWDHRGYARPTFWNPKKDIYESGFKE